MFTGFGGQEILVLIILAVVMFGPERIPEFSRKAARVIWYLRNIANTATTQLKEELGPEYKDLTLDDLNPKTFIQKHLLDDLQADLDSIKEDLADVKKELNDAGSVATGAASGALAAANSAAAGAEALQAVTATAEPGTPGATKAEWGITFDPEAT